MALSPLRMGFVPLVDAAPLIAARERGYFGDEGLVVSLHRQVGWANIRDKLSYGHIDVGHALLGMPPASLMGRDSFTEPLVALLGVGTGGNAITVRRELYERGVKSAADLGAVMGVSRRVGRLMVGHVFGSSMHHYLVREWLSWCGIDPDRQVKLCVIPPPQMAEHMRGGYVDVFCAGEPWNTVAARLGCGVPVVATTDLVPGHPEKVLAVARRFLAGGRKETLVGLVRAVMRGCQWCEDAGNREALAEMLARPEYLALPPEVLRQSLAIGRDFGVNMQTARPADWRMRSFAAAFPNKLHFAWMMREMIRWGHLHAEADVLGMADACADSEAYRAAAATLHVECPETDFATMNLRGGRVLRREDFVMARGSPRLASAGAAQLVHMESADA